jgi:hypothetical protein
VSDEERNKFFWVVTGVAQKIETAAVRKICVG